MVTAEHWLTPWAALGRTGTDYAALPEAGGGWRWEGGGTMWLCVPDGVSVTIDGARPSRPEVLRLPDRRRVFALALPPRASAGIVLAVGGTTWRIGMPDVPDRPDENEEPATPAQYAAHALLARVLAVWARLRDVEPCLADPATIWPQLTARWLDEATTASPQMDVIVKHARTLARTLALLGRAPRRVLRRHNTLVPLDRVQEMDRRAMLWLVRQPGTSLVERAGDRQRILAVAREQSYDTLENRVLHSYARLASGVARDYEARQRGAVMTGRAQLVRGFGKACRHLATDLREHAVREAPADVTPNFVLQNNTNYSQVWRAWRELLRRKREVDELWRWQARSWEEFCALAVVVALQSCGEARAIATSPIVFREEQDQGRWLRHVNPLAVFHLPLRDMVVEVSFDRAFAGPLRFFGAPIWLRYGRVGDAMGFLRRCAIWPVWHARGGLHDDEAERVERVLDDPGAAERPVAGIVVRPGGDDGAVAVARSRRGRVSCLTIGPEGSARAAGIGGLRDAMLRVLGHGGG